MNTGELIIKARTAAGLSQKEVAQSMGISPQALAQYEKSRRRPKPATLRRIAEAIGCPVSDLIGDDMKISREDQEGLSFDLGMFGENPPADPEHVREDEKTLLQYYRKLEVERKEKVVDYAVDQYGSQIWERTAPEDGPDHIQN